MKTSALSLLFFIFAPTNRNNMRKSFIIMLMCLTASFILPSCEKEVFNYNSQMNEYYVESRGLMAVSLDSVTLFENKVNDFVTTYPLAKEYEKYPLILSNIKEASFRITIVIDTAWAGHDYIRF